MDDEAASWIESRRLIVTQLRSMDEAIRGLADKIEKQNEIARERLIGVATDTNKEIGELRVRISMLEISAKIWGGMIGLVGGTLATLIINILPGKLSK